MSKKKVTRKKSSKTNQPIKHPFRNLWNPVYNNDFHPSEFVRLSEFGYTLAEIAANFDIDKATLWRWSKDKENKPDFVDAYKVGRTKTEAWFVKYGKRMMNGQVKNGNPSTYIWLSKVQLGWNEDDPLNDETDDLIEGVEFD